VRRLLISGQVAFSVILLVSAATFLRQTHHMADADHTLRTERIVAVDLEDVPYETFRRTVDGLPDVEMTAALSHLMLGPSNYSARDILLPNDTEARRTTYYSVDSTFIAQMGLELIARRSGWAESLMAEEGVLFDRNAARAYGFDNPQDLVGTEITFPESSPSSRVVVGVVENFESGGIAEVYSAGMVSASAPRMFLWAPEAVYHALVRSQSGDVAALRDQLETVWQTRLATDHPFSAQLYADVTRMRYGPLQDAAFMTSGVAGLAILIAILGLLSLAAHHVQTRRKEVGVRKALGARLHEVVVELSRDFAVLVVGAAVLATPVAWLLNQWWLQFMTDRVGVSVVVVSACVIALVGLSLLVIGSQTLRAARLNPVHALRDE
jgi:putative ABC transport system permease protein